MSRKPSRTLLDDMAAHIKKTGNKSLQAFRDAKNKSKAQASNNQAPSTLTNPANTTNNLDQTFLADLEKLRQNWEIIKEQAKDSKFLNSKRTRRLKYGFLCKQGRTSHSRMSFGRSKKQLARNSQGIFKKDYTAGLESIEERRRPKKGAKGLYGPGGRKRRKGSKKGGTDARSTRGRASQHADMMSGRKQMRNRRGQQNQAGKPKVGGQGPSVGNPNHKKPVIGGRKNKRSFGGSKTYQNARNPSPRRNNLLKNSGDGMKTSKVRESHMSAVGALVSPKASKIKNNRFFKNESKKRMMATTTDLRAIEEPLGDDLNQKSGILMSQSTRSIKKTEKPEKPDFEPPSYPEAPKTDAKAEEEQSKASSPQSSTLNESTATIKSTKSSAKKKTLRSMADNAMAKAKLRADQIKAKKEAKAMEKKKMTNTVKSKTRKNSSELPTREADQTQKSTPRNRTTANTRANSRGKKPESKELTEGQIMYQAIEKQFKDALKTVEELEQLAGGNPISKLSFKRELMKFLSACKAKARKVKAPQN